MGRRAGCQRGVLLALALLAAACGDDGASETLNADATSPSAAPAPQDAATPSATTPSEPPTTTEDPPRPTPEVVVDLTDTVFDLGIHGVAAAGNIFGAEILTPEIPQVNDLDPAIADAITAGQFFGFPDFSIEALYALEPDLIITSPLYQSYLPPGLDLTDVAPVTVIDDDLPWQERSPVIGELVGQGPAAQARIDAAASAVDELAERVTELGLTGSSVAVFGAFGGQLVVFVGPGTAGDPLAILPDSVPDDAISAFGTERTLPADPFLWTLNSVIAVEEIVEALHRALDVLAR